MDSCVSHGVTYTPNNSEMNNNFVRKIQFGGWDKRSYKEIRRLVAKRIKKEIEEDMVELVDTPDYLKE